jgi:signal transduction histidine kinase
MVANLQLLTDMLRREGYKVRPVPSGALALQAVRAKAPDLILLDISMPDMDGFAVCRELKRDPVLRDIPVIFISALSETLDKVRAFGCGAVDYVTKPFQFEEVLVRVATHLRLHFAERTLHRQMKELKHLEGLRDDLVHMVVHDMRGVLQAVLCSLELLAPEDLPERSRDLLETAQEGASRLTRLVTGMLDISRLEVGQLIPEPSWIDGPALARDVSGLLSPAYPNRRVEVTFDGPSAPIWGDRNLVQRVLQNLVSNALSFTEAGGLVRVSFKRIDLGFEARIIDQGPGIPPERIGKLFDKFAATERNAGGRASYGLGLAFCKLAIMGHDGRIGVDSTVGKGSEFWFWLPDPKPVYDTNLSVI